MGVVYAVLGLIGGVLMAVFSLAVSSMAGNAALDTGENPFGPAAGAMGAMFGIGAIVFFPILYGIIGFIGGAVGALVYNVVAGMVGGVEIDVDGPGPARIGNGS